MMSRRFGLKAGIAAVALTGLFGFGLFKRAHAHGGWGHGGRQAIMKRVVTSAIDEVLDEAKVTPPQRATINAARDRVFTAFERSRQDHRSDMDDALSLFESDRIDPSRVAALRGQREAKMKELGDVVQQAIIEAHDTLTPEQRRVVTSRIRAFHAEHE
jgi:Spy/CpxP family protein refolding chaperone